MTNMLCTGITAFSQAKSSYAGKASVRYHGLLVGFKFFERHIAVDAAMAFFAVFGKAIRTIR